MFDLEKTPVSAVMTTDVLLLNGNTTIREAVATLEDYGVSGAPVVDEGGAAIGVFSLADLARRDAEVEEGEAPRRASYFGLGLTERLPTSAEAYDSELFERETVGDWMSMRIDAVAPDASVVEAARIMAREEIHRLVVMEGKAIRGILTTLDLARWIAATADETARATTRAKTERRRAAAPARSRSDRGAPARKRKRSA